MEKKEWTGSDIDTEIKDKSLLGVNQSEGLYTNADIFMWEEGAAKYKEFVSNVKEIDKYNQEDKGGLQAMFLGEKPACFYNRLALSHKEELENLGFEFIGNYCFRPELVLGVIEKYKKDIIFLDQDPIKLMEELNMATHGEQNIIRGLVLGFPLSSVLGYEKATKFGIEEVIKSLYDLLPNDGKKYLEETFYNNRQGNQEMFNWIIDRLLEYRDVLKLDESRLTKVVDGLKMTTNARLIDVNGISWTEYEYSADSVIKQNRLMASFKKGGFLSNEQV